MSSTNCCGFCGGPGHNLRNCGSDLKTLLISQFRQVNNLTIDNFLRQCRTNELSVIMIHEYNAHNVSMTKPSKIIYITSCWRAATYGVTETEEIDDVYQDQVSNIPSSARISQIAEELIQEMRLQFDAMLASGAENQPFVSCYRQIVRDVIHHPEILQHPYLKNQIVAHLRTFAIQYFINMNEADFTALIPLPALQPVVAAKKHYISILKPNKWSVENEDVECMVCYEGIKENNIATMNCCHQLCVGCIVGLVENRAQRNFINCPYCRSDISTISINCPTISRKFMADFELAGSKPGK